ncbi:hypothetical protein HS088_TW08G00823 [Tripterygium wilfordii]|uniref:3'-5' exonuclease domain-containing protein n=1 Tax=Tripterygium wilfordii TaxID=458696 RepID=A0A7J7DCX4_TRIWF|nr:hypothetical protein HS088_TW08G00823 [Tripterygium wilfordii]
MVMEISVEHLTDELSSNVYDTYTVYVEGHRILVTVVHSEHAASAGKWLKEALKIQNTRLRDTVVVGVIAGHDLHYGFLNKDLRTTPYDLIQLCIGSHCLLYFLPWKYKAKETGLKFMNNFLSQPKVFAVGMNIKVVAKRLEQDFHVKVENPVDLNELAVRGMNRDDLDLVRYDLDRLAKLVLGKGFDVERPNYYLEWYYRRRWVVLGELFYHEELNPEKVKFASVDTYFCFLIGSQLLETIHLKKKNENKAAEKKKSKKK